MNESTQSQSFAYDTTGERLAKFSLTVNKFVLSLPLLAVFFMLFPDNPILARNTEKSLGMLLMGAGLLSYPMVFAVGRVLAKQRFEKGEYRRSIYMSWMPAVCIALTLIGYAIA
jgi:uncharacterized PurR-regulated membrane protein YhhQ (DUF165 family)